MAEISLPKFGTIGLGIVGFIKGADNTIFGQFLRWFPFGWGCSMAR